MQRPETEEQAEIRGLEETARFFSTSIPTVKGWLNEPDFPIVERGGNGVPYKLDLRQVAAWLRARQDEKDRREEERAERDAQLKLELLGDDQLPDVGEDGTGKLSAKGRAEALKAELAKVHLAQLRRKLVSAADMQMQIADMFKEIRDRLRLLPDDLSREFGLNEAQTAAMLERIDDFLRDLADRVEQIGQEAAEDAAA